MTGYLFVHFIGEQENGEQVYFSVSRDGLHWRDLNGGKPVLRSSLGDGGVRDPFLVRHPQTGVYHLIATDLCIHKRQDWHSAEFAGSRSLVVWDSADLIHWSAPRLCPVGVEEAGCVWAPESVFDEEKEQFFVFWASMAKLPGDTKAKQRIYGAFTPDFVSFSKPFVYAEAENHLIDMTIVRDGDWYYRFTKDETTKTIRLDRVRTLIGSPAEPIHATPLDTLYGVEGPECYPLPDGRWCLIVDQFHKRLGYLPLTTRCLSAGQFEVVPPDAYSFGQTKKRHGGVILITEEELARLSQAFAS